MDTKLRLAQIQYPFKAYATHDATSPRLPLSIERSKLEPPIVEIARLCGGVFRSDGPQPRNEGQKTSNISLRVSGIVATAGNIRPEAAGHPPQDRKAVGYMIGSFANRLNRKYGDMNYGGYSQTLVDSSLKRTFLIALSSFIVFLGLTLSFSGHAETEWPVVNHDFSAQRHVDVPGFTRDNIERLHVLCDVHLNEPSWFGSGILEVEKTLYVTTLHATYAVSATDCRPRWRSIVPYEKTALPSYFATRGAAYHRGMLFRGTNDGRLLALDAGTGALRWSAQVANPSQNEYVIAAPIAWSGRVFLGIASSDLGIRGRVMALDAANGRPLWTFQSMEMGNELGGGFWTSFSLDEVTGTLFAPVSNPSPVFYRKTRPGPNRHTNSVLALDAKTGVLRWNYQAIPADEHDWDLSTTPMLYPGEEARLRLAVTGKSGLVYGVDPLTSQLLFKTPGTTLLNTEVPLTEHWLRVCPGSGAQYNGTAYNPGLGLLYVGMIDWCRFFMSSPPTSNSDHEGGATSPDYKDPPRGMLTALEGSTGRVRWQIPQQAPVIAGLVSTPTNLLFSGDVKGVLKVMDAETGQTLKSIDLDATLNHGLIAYSLDHEPRIAVATGGVSLATAGVAGPISLKILGLGAPWSVKHSSYQRLLPPEIPGSPGMNLYLAICGNCHGRSATGGLYPSLMRNGDLSDPGRLRHFLATVSPPMPKLYPGLLRSSEVDQIAGYLGVSIFGCRSDPVACKPPGKPRTLGTRDWRLVYSVLTSPRCINCHTGTGATDPATSDFPRQTDLRRPHLYGVSRGTDDHGEGNGRCDSCHGLSNNPETGAPGVSENGKPLWQLAPTSMAWESSPGQPMDGASLCGMILDPALNGGLDAEGLIQHVEHNPIVLWAWNPGLDSRGKPRTRPPFSHREFVAAFSRWLKHGGECPGG